jgi:hypothetical protein
MITVNTSVVVVPNRMTSPLLTNTVGSPLVTRTKSLLWVTWNVHPMAEVGHNRPSTPINPFFSFLNFVTVTIR